MGATRPRCRRVLFPLHPLPAVAKLFPLPAASAPTSVRDYVQMLVVKGNLKHRIWKLGVEKPEGELTPTMRKLRKIAEEQNFVGEDAPSRPAWGNGAFFF